MEKAVLFDDIINVLLKIVLVECNLKVPWLEAGDNFDPVRSRQTFDNDIYFHLP